MKISIMMLVHKNEQQTQKLINHLSKDFDVFVHIDKRSKIKLAKKANVYIYKKYNTYWGSFNQIMATLYLLKEAYNIKYDRYILISGQDLPLVTNIEIKKFFEGNEYEYIDINRIPTNDGWPNMDRLTAYHLNDKHHGEEGGGYIAKCVKNFYLTIRKISFAFSKIMPRKIDYDFHGGANWSNYTHNCVNKIFNYLKNNKKYIKRYYWTNCADEIFYQTIIYQLEGIKIVNDCLRYIDWKNGPEYPRTLRLDDYEKITSSKALFARKFDEKIDRKIIEKIYKRIEENVGVSYFL